MLVLESVSNISCGGRFINFLVLFYVLSGKLKLPIIATEMSVEEDVMKIQKKLTKMTSDDGTVSEENSYSIE